MTTLHQIKNKSVCLLSHPQDIAHSFAEFYTDLYNNPGIPRHPPSRGMVYCMQQYLEKSGISQLQPSDLSSVKSLQTTIRVLQILSPLVNPLYVQTF